MVRRIALLLPALLLVFAWGARASSASAPRFPSPLEPTADEAPGGSLPSAPPPADPPIHRLLSPAVVRDGRPPPSGPIPECHAPRIPSPDAEDLLPAAADSVFLSCQVVAYYGFPGVRGMGVLGTASPDEVAEAVLDMAAAYDAVNGRRGAVGAFHIVAVVAQDSATSDGTWVARISATELAPYLESARDYNLLVILDVQPGHSSALAEIARLLPYLQDPRVQLALDPEWAMQPGEVPGTVIGGLDAAEINEVQAIMSAYLLEHGLSRRLLVVHQFVPSMIRNKEALRSFDRVDLVIDTDGFGSPGQKAANYNRFIAGEGAPHGGFKLFFAEDAPLMRPEAVVSLDPQPDLVVYQ